MVMEEIYLDNAATTFPKPECVYQTMDEIARTGAVNAGRGSYALARKASGLIESTRKQIKELAGADDVAEVVFTASATLACNLILGGFEWKQTDIVYVSPFEHNAMMRVLHHYQKQYGFKILELALDKESLELDLPQIRFQFTREHPTVVVMSHVSNVTGYILPVDEVAESAKQYGAVVAVDGSQALGLVPVKLKESGIDFYVFAGHKTLYGPFGVGGFISGENVSLKPFLSGGTGSDSLNPDMPGQMPGVLEPGSPNIVAIAGLYASLEDDCDREAELFRERKLAEYLTENLKKVDGVLMYLPQDETKRTGIVSFSIEGYRADEVGMLLDEDYHIAVRTGYQCAPLIHKYLKDEIYGGVIRVGIGRFTKQSELETLVKAIEEIAEG